MDHDRSQDTVADQDRRLRVLERLMASSVSSLKPTLDHARPLLAEEFGADMVDAFLFEPETTSLLALGSGQTPLARQQHAAGLDRIPQAQEDRSFDVFTTGIPYLTGHADQDPHLRPGLTQVLGIRSLMAVRLAVDDQVRGVLEVASVEPEQFSEPELHFLQVVARWLELVIARAELAECLEREDTARDRWGAAEELIAILAHDLRNSLTPLHTHIEQIQKRTNRENQPGLLREATWALASLARVRGMINDLLDVTRLDQGVFTVNPQPVNMVQLVSETAADLRSPTVEIRVQTPDEVIVAVDPERIRQALENLLSNAIQHSPAGVPVELYLGTEHREAVEWAVIRVCDQGCGIPPEFLPQLFERFWRGPGSNGLGLGLYVAREIAEAHAGTLAVDSRWESGTCFQLALRSI